MIYLVSKEFISISADSATIQNTSQISTVEVSDSAEPDSGFLLYPLKKISVRGSPIFIRCLDGAAYVRVVSFISNAAPASSTPTEPTEPTDNTGKMIDEMWNSTEPSDTDNIIDEMWDSTEPTDTSDVFQEYLDGVFNP